MSTKNEGFDFNGCHAHRAGIAANIAGMYSNGPAIFEKAKEEKELRAKEAKEKEEDDETEDAEDDDDDDDIDDTDNEDLDEKSKVEKSAFQTLGVEYNPPISKSKK